VFVHDSDAVPGRANLWAGKFAARVGISYPEAAQYFPKKAHVALVGNPIRHEIRELVTHDAHAYFQFSKELPTLLVIGGSQGAEVINNTVLRALPELLNQYQVIHQVGKANYEAYKEILEVELRDHPHLAARYRLFPFLNALELRTAAGAADLILSRAGSGSIFEIACWERPAILVPIPQNVSRDQRKNAYAYARVGGAEVIEQHNFTPHVLTSEVDRIIADVALRERMQEGAKHFKKPDAARAIAQELLRICLEHDIT
jgi:UDP-N-acetylglucosamine--N-acetylmuramyl-(pentapeptide) pyrophosphoryl-undecaprenol N-acetylglucosamine transferase